MSWRRSKYQHKLEEMEPWHGSKRYSVTLFTVQYKIDTDGQSGRRGGLMVSVMDSGSSGPGSSPDWGTALCSWAKHFTLMVPLFTQVYNGYWWIYCWRVTLPWTNIPSRGSRNTPSRFMLWKPGWTPALIGYLARIKTLPLPTIVRLNCRKGWLI